MKLALTQSSILITLACFCCLLLMPQTTTAQGLVTVSEVTLRKLASSTVMPDYPQASQKRGSKGIAVVRVDLDEKGALGDLRIVEAPDKDIEAAVLDAVRRWKFAAAQGAKGESYRLRGKLTFYFVSASGQFRVENPRQYN
jgi:TonB family protein